ncbi:MAG: exodeoxyribonuclease III [candidate division WOR-3 bacterium]|nr:exodeoxyribonuclease III [candidate division WOR-3 bacterium]
MAITMLSWNINGIRAIERKGFSKFLKKESPDIMCIQETKAQEEQIPEALTDIDDYHTVFASAEKKGYSGVGTFSKIKPNDITKGIGVERFDREGRILRSDYDDFILFNIYFPNGKSSQKRLDFKMSFYETFLQEWKSLLDMGEKIVICGDVNTAHKEIDLARPKANEDRSGFLPIERKWIDDLMDAGFIDTFRYFHKEPDNYSWWDYKTKARERNVGWRIDYFFISQNLENNLKSAFTRDNIMGSDHCPVGIELDI